MGTGGGYRLVAGMAMPPLLLDDEEAVAITVGLATAAPTLLAPNGVLVVELGIGQAEPVAHLFAAAGLAPSPPRPDLNGTPRALVARKRA